MVILYLVWMFLKLVKGKRVISLSSCLDVLKIRMKMRGNDLNKQIYPYLEIFFYLINKAKTFFFLTVLLLFGCQENAIPKEIFFIVMSAL